MNLKNKEGKKINNVLIPIIRNGEWKKIESDEIFTNKKVIVFALPGAMTPTCSNTHLPEYEELYSVFLENGIDEVYCLSVNDTFVMNDWAKSLGIKNVKMLPDGNADLTREVGMLVDKRDLGFGERSWRYSMVVNNGVIEKMFIEPQEPGDPFKVSDATTMLKYINPKAQRPDNYVVLARDGCPFCEKTKVWMRDNSFSHTVIEVDAKTLKTISGKNTYPQIYKNGKNLGGYSDLVK